MESSSKKVCPTKSFRGIFKCSRLAVSGFKPFAAFAHESLVVLYALALGFSCCLRQLFASFCPVRGLLVSLYQQVHPNRVGACRSTSASAVSMLRSSPACIAAATLSATIRVTISSTMCMPVIRRGCECLDRDGCGRPFLRLRLSHGKPREQ